MLTRTHYVILTCQVVSSNEQLAVAVIGGRRTV